MGDGSTADPGPPRGGVFQAGGRRAVPIASAAALAAAHAVLFAAAFPGMGAWPAVCVALVPLGWLALCAPSSRVAVGAVLLTQVPMWLWLQRWLAGVTPAGYPLLAVYMSLYPALFVWILRRASRHRHLGRVPFALAVPLLWVGMECLRGEVVMHGYPWFLLAHPAIGWPALVQSADLLGTYFVSFLAASASGAVIDAIRAARGSTPGPAPGPRAAFGAVGAVVLLSGANVAYGLFRLGEAKTPSGGLAVLAVQTNLPQSNKILWTLEDQRGDLEAFLGQTRAALQGAGPVDLVVWPETMLPGLGLEPQTLEFVRARGEELEPWASGPERLAALAREHGAAVLVGSAGLIEPVWVEEGGLESRFSYNSAYLIQEGEPLQRYDKVVLTPFGETMPYISRWEWLERKLLAIGARGMRFDLDAGARIRRLELRWPGGAGSRAPHSGYLTLATPICFEDTVARYVRRMVYAQRRKDVHVLVNLSNDGWFGDHDAGRAQHEQIARFRCVENRVPMVRCVNTGLTAAIDSCGRRLEGAPPAREAGALRARVELDARRSLYGRRGPGWEWISLAGAVLLSAATFLWRVEATP